MYKAARAASRWSWKSAPECLVASSSDTLQIYNEQVDDAEWNERRVAGLVEMRH